MSGSYRDLKAWQKSTDLVAEIYACTRAFPKDEQYGLVSQLRRAAVSVASNIAEGKGRSGDKELVRFLHQARDHCAKSRPSLRLPIDSGLLSSENASRLNEAAGEIARMLNGLINALKRSMATRRLMNKRLEPDDYA